MRSAVLAAVVLVAGLGPVPGAGAVGTGCAPAAVSVGDRTLYEGTPGPGDPTPAYTTFTFTVSVAVAAGCSATGSVAFKTENGSAAAPADYAATTGTLTWNGDTASRTVAVPVVKDAGAEANEAFLLRLYNPAGVSIADDLAAGGVLDDDGGAGPKMEVSTDGGKICWRVCSVGLHLSTPAKAPVTVHYRTLPVGTGAPAYVPVQDALVTIPAGASAGQAPVTLLPPQPGQGDSQFVLELFSPSAGTLGTARAVVTITPGG